MGGSWSCGLMCVTFTGKSLSEGTIFHGQTQETRTEFQSLGIFLVRGVKNWNHILSKPRLLWIPKSFAQLTVYTSSGLRHPHSINSRIQARFLHNFMAAWIPIGLCMNNFGCCSHIVEAEPLMHSTRFISTPARKWAKWMSGSVRETWRVMGMETHM